MTRIVNPKNPNPSIHSGRGARKDRTSHGHFGSSRLVWIYKFVPTPSRSKIYAPSTASTVRVFSDTR